jgi:hypothetical protein
MGAPPPSTDDAGHEELSSDLADPVKGHHVHPAHSSSDRQFKCTFGAGVFNTIPPLFLETIRHGDIATKSDSRKFFVVRNNTFDHA